MQRLMLIFWEQTGGEEGITGLTPLIRSQLGFYYFALGTLAAITALLLALARSHWGSSCGRSAAKKRPARPPASTSRSTRSLR